MILTLQFRCLQMKPIVNKRKVVAVVVIIVGSNLIEYKTVYALKGLLIFIELN